MDQAIRELLEAADDSIHVEEPPDLDWERLGERITRLEPKLSRIAGIPFDLDGDAEDATFFGDLESIQSSGERGTVILVRLGVRFSNFGSLFTTWNSPHAPPLPTRVVEEVVRAVSEAGFVYIPTDALAAPYTGQNPTFKGATWWIRFFDYI